MHLGPSGFRPGGIQFYLRASQPCLQSILLSGWATSGSYTDRSIKKQNQPSQTPGQQNRAQNTNRNTGGLPWNLGPRQSSTANIWSSNPLMDTNLPSRDTTGATGSYKRGRSSDTGGAELTTFVASTQRPNAIGAQDSSLWARPTASTWTSSDSTQFRANSTSPPNPLQPTSNTSPSFTPSRSSTQQNTTFPSSSSNFITNFASTANPSTNYASNYAENTLGDNGTSFQLMGLQRGTSGLSSAYDEREAMLPPSRHSESEAPLQFGTETAFGGGLGSHSRHPSRLSLSGAATTSFAPQQPTSRSQSHSFQQPEQAQAAVDNIRAHLLRDRLQNGSPGPRTNGAQASTPASQFGWRDFTPSNAFSLANGNMQDSRRDSLANSVHNSTMNSPRTYGNQAQRQSDPWTPGAAPVDYEALNRLQRSQGQMPRQAAQQSYLDAVSYSPYGEIPVQLMQQVHPAFQLPFQGYGFQPSQQFFPPTGPAGMMSRGGGRPQDLTVGIRCQELEEFRRSSKSNRKWELKVCRLLSAALVLGC